MKILVVADIHGDFQTLGKIMSSVNVDAVICPGNLTDMFKIPQEFSQMDVAELVVQKLLSLGKPVFCVPGNHDPYEIIDLFEDYKVNLHSKSLKMLGQNIAGFGGAQTPFRTLFEPTEEEIKESLSKFTNPSILVVHNPPKNTKLDKIKSGEHVGSQSVRDFVKKTKPLLVICAHIHEATGKDQLGPSVIFNPGPVFKGYYGLVEMGKEITCKIKKI